MKTLPAFILSIILFGTLLTQSANGQWYNNQFGVDSLGELTPDQYSIALKKANQNMRIGTSLAKTGLGMTVGGVGLTGIGLLILMGSMTEEISEGLTDIGFVSIYGGLILTLIGPIPVFAGIPFLIIGRKRKNDLEKTFGKALSKISINPKIDWHQNKCFVGAQLTLSLTQH